MLPEVLELFAVGIAVYDAGGALVCANRAAKRHLDDPLVARTMRAAQARDGVGAVAANEKLQVCSVATGSLVIAIVSRAGHTSIAAAARLYELTPTKERIAALLADGGTARQIATQLEVSLHTVQSHLKSIFGKTQTSIQNELIARLRGGIALLALEEFFLVAPAIKGGANNPDSLSRPTRSAPAPASAFSCSTKATVRDRCSTRRTGRSAPSSSESSTRS